MKTPRIFGGLAGFLFGASIVIGASNSYGQASDTMKALEVGNRQMTFDALLDGRIDDARKHNAVANGLEWFGRNLEAQESYTPQDNTQNQNVPNTQNQNTPNQPVQNDSPGRKPEVIVAYNLKAMPYQGIKEGLISSSDMIGKFEVEYSTWIHNPKSSRRFSYKIKNTPEFLDWVKRKRPEGGKMLPEWVEKRKFDLENNVYTFYRDYVATNNPTGRFISMGGGTKLDLPDDRLIKEFPNGYVYWSQRQNMPYVVEKPKAGN